MSSIARRNRKVPPANKPGALSPTAGSAFRGDTSISPTYHGKRDVAIVQTLRDVPEWLDEKILRCLSGYPEPGCWEWRGTLVNGRDPQARLPRGAYGPRNAGVSVRRAVWLALVGPIPDGLVLHPTCGNSRCCNPEHVVSATFGELWRRPEVDSQSPLARNARKTHCHRGHELTPDNILPFAARRGWRACRACLAERHELVRAAAGALGFQWREYAAEHGLSRAEALRIINEQEAQDKNNTTD